MENIFNDIKFGPNVGNNLIKKDIEEYSTSYEIDTCITVINQPFNGTFVIGETYLIVDVDYSDNTLLLVDENNFEFWVDFSDVQY